MPVLQVVASKPRAGKSAIAAGIAAGLAARGGAVALVRAGQSPAAAADAHAFAAYAFASSPGKPLAPDAVEARAGQTAIVELDAAAAPLAHPAVLVVRGDLSPEDAALASRLGSAAIGAVATAVAPGNEPAIAKAIEAAGLRVLALLPEDRVLAAPSVADIRHALAADVLFEGENMDEAVENVLVAPVYTDGAKTHFQRFPGSKAVLTPSYKTDLLLASIEAGAACLVVTGGHQPSQYVLDRASHEPVTIMLAQHQTPAAVAALSDVWGGSAFAGEAKLRAVQALLEPRLDWEALVKTLGD